MYAFLKLLGLCPHRVLHRWGKWMYSRRATSSFKAYACVRRCRDCDKEQMRVQRGFWLWGG